MPGLDFINHSNKANCWWEIRQPTLESTKQPSSSSSNSNSRTQQAAPVAEDAATEEDEDLIGLSGAIQLLTTRRPSPKAGTELTISYGDKSNEELLLLYGFALPKNPHDCVMVACPVPPSDQWDDIMHARMQLLQLRGLKPQFFLSLGDLERHMPGGGAQATSSAAGAAASTGTPTATWTIPDNVKQTIEAFVMPKESLMTALEAAERAANADSGSSGSTGQSGTRASSNSSGAGKDVSQQVDEKGMLMAVVSTLVRLLEMKVRHVNGGNLQHEPRSQSFPA